MVNNKHERRVKAKVKQKRRALIASRGRGIFSLPIKWLHKLKSMSTPCLCAMCSPSKEIIKGVVKQKQKSFDEEMKFHKERFEENHEDYFFLSDTDY